MSGAVPWYDDVVTTPMRRTGSYWAVPDQPGLGVEINEVEAAKHPFKQEVIHTEGAVLEDGTIVDW
jgi:galactonate dehydratase